MLWGYDRSFAQWERLWGQWASLKQRQKGNTCLHFRAAMRQPEYWGVGSSDLGAVVHENKATENGGAGRNNTNQEMAVALKPEKPKMADSNRI